MEDEMSKSNEIWVTKFDEEHAQKFRHAVMEVAKSDPSRPVIVYIDSYGGYVDALAKMIETLDEIPNPIITACMGKAMSCGAILLSHGDVRFLGRHSRVMVHEVSSGTIGNVQDMKEDVKETVRLNEYFMGLLAKNCGFKNYAEFRAVIKDQDGRDRFLAGQDAIEFGIVDTIGLPKVSARVTFEVAKSPVRTPFADRNKQTIVSGSSRGKRKKKSANKTKKSDTRKR
jgi:ATP-dependent Clp endopeptidase proteolytic subunit ClpP